ETERAPEFVPPAADDESGEWGPIDDASTFEEALTAGHPDTPSSIPPPTSAPDSDDTAIIEGTLRAPWKWETLSVESAVIGGDPPRWHRRLSGLANEMRLQRNAELKDDPDSPRVARLDRDLRNLGHLRAFALPIIDLLAAWPARGTWGEWLDRFAALAAM